MIGANAQLTASELNQVETMMGQGELETEMDEFFSQEPAASYASPAPAAAGGSADAAPAAATASGADVEAVGAASTLQQAPHPPEPPLLGQRVRIVGLQQALGSEK